MDIYHLDAHLLYNVQDLSALHDGAILVEDRVHPAQSVHRGLGVVVDEEGLEFVLIKVNEPLGEAAVSEVHMLGLFFVDVRGLLAGFQVRVVHRGSVVSLESMISFAVGTTVAFRSLR